MKIIKNAILLFTFLFICNVICFSQSNYTNDLDKTIDKLCKAVNSSDKNALKDFSGLSPQEILDGFTNEYDPDAKPECTSSRNLDNPFNYKASDTEYYFYAQEFGDGYGSLLLSFENGKWIAKKFVGSWELEKIKQK